MRKRPFRPTLAMKLALLLLVVVLAPVFVVQMTLYDRYRRETDDRTLAFRENAFDGLYQRAEGCFAEMKAQASYLFYTGDLLKPLSHAYAGVDRTLVDDEALLGERFLDANRLYPKVQSVYTYLVEDGRIFGTWGTLPFDADVGWLKEALLLPSQRGQIWTVFETEHTSPDFARIAPSLALIRQVSGKRRGTLIVSLPLARFETALELGAEPLADTGVLLFDQRGTLRFHGGRVLPETVVDLARRLSGEAAENVSSRLREAGYTLLSQRLSTGRFALVAVIDESSAYTALDRQRGVTLFLLIGFSVLMVCLTFTTVFRMMKRMKRLDSAMRRFAAGEQTAGVILRGRDEVAEMARHYNGMLAQIEALVKRTQEDEKEKMRLHYEALTAQIQPHFLYNTLNSIKWVAMLSGAANVADLIASLGALLEASTARQSEILPLGEELANLRHYMNLQYARYGERVGMQIHVPEALEPLMVPKFILQPFVENALIHGFDQQQRKGMITIEARHTGSAKMLHTGDANMLQTGSAKMLHTGDALMLLVIDDGYGITKARLEEVLTGGSRDEHDRRRQSIGMLGVHRRIQYLYGKAYGIAICTAEGEGTTIRLRLPLCALSEEAAHA